MNLPRHDDAERAEQIARRLHVWSEDPSRDLLELQRITHDLALLLNDEMRRSHPSLYFTHEEEDDNE